MSDGSEDPFVIVGGGFTGLAAAYELAKRGEKVLILERETSVGGLARGFHVGDQTLERFYHHWFTNDTHVMKLIDELDCADQVILRPTRTGMYYANTIFRLSTPLDLLRFSALGFVDRIRLGLLALRARAIRNWKSIESLTAREWLIKLAGAKVFKVVWEPLLIGKFGPYADRVGAVWFWKKLVLRGGSRTRDGRETLAYYQGGFCELAETLKRRLEGMGVEIRTGVTATGIERRADGNASAVVSQDARYAAKAILLTQSLPLIAELLKDEVDSDYAQQLNRIEYLASLCLVLVLDRSLSETYWLNVNDPSFPFVGVIEHTNFEPPESYGGRHIVYLSKYLPETDELMSLSDEDMLAFALPHLKRMFPAFDRQWVTGHHVWRARYTQQITEPNYSEIVPDQQTPIGNVLIASMAQIYPEDRGTNYAIREGRRVAAHLADRFGASS